MPSMARYISKRHAVLVVKPTCSSPVHHHGEQDTIIYVASGKGQLLTSPKDEDEEPRRDALARGDFAFVPSWTEHQVRNECEKDDLALVIIRSGSHPVEVNLSGWAGDETKESLRT